MLETIPAQAALDDAIASVQGTVDEKGAKIECNYLPTANYDRRIHSRNFQHAVTHTRDCRERLRWPSARLRREPAS